MRKWRWPWLVLVMITMLLASGAEASQLKPIWLVVNGQFVDVRPGIMLEHERLMVPLRLLAQLGGFNVAWNSSSKEIVLQGSNRIQLKIDQSLAIVNQQQLTLDAPPRLWQDTTMIPLRFVAEMLGGQVTWKPAARVVFVNWPPPVVVLAYHDFFPGSSAASGAVIDPDVAYQQWKWFLESGYKPMTLSQLEQYLQGNLIVTEPRFVITIDDGYESVYTYAWPLLQQLQLPAAVFLIARYHDQQATDPVTKFIPKLKTEQIEIMSRSGLVEFQNHTYDLHAKQAVAGTNQARSLLVTSSPEAVLADLIHARQTIQARTQKAVYALAYPYGEFSPELEPVLKTAGLRLGFTVTPGWVSPGNFWRINRYTMEHYPPDQLTKLFGWTEN